jgi:hypothetical protein
MHRLARLRYCCSVLSATFLLIQGCGSGTTAITGTGSITLSLSPASATVPVGGSTQVAGTIVRTNFTGDVAIAVQNAPTGVTGTINSSPTGGGNSASVTLNVTSATTPGTYTLTVIAIGTGISNATATFTLTVAVAPSYTISLNSSTGSIAQGASGNTAVTFTRTNFTGNITPSVDNLPAGVTAVFAPNPVTGISSLLTLTVGASVPAGVYNLAIHGTASGATDVTTPLTLTVTPSSYTISLSSSTASISQGASGNTTATLTRTNFTGNIILSVDNLPTGVTAAFAPNPATGTTSVLTLTVGGGATAGVYNLAVHGTTSGLTDVTTPLTLTVTAPVLVRLDFTGCTYVPIWMAYQDGSGPWIRATGTGNVYTFTISSLKGAYAYVVLEGTAYITSVSYNNQAELAALAPFCTTGNTINGTLAGLSAGDGAVLSLGGASSFGVVFGAHGFQLSGVAPGSQDFFGYRRSTITPGTTDKAIIRRSQNIANGGSLALVDFGSAEAFSAPSATFTITGGSPADMLSSGMLYKTGAACVGSRLYASTIAYTGSTTQNGIPSAQQVSTDFHQFFAGDASSVSSREIWLTFHTFAAKSLALPAALPTPTVTTPSGGIGVRRQAALTLPSDYSSATFTYSDNLNNQEILSASAGYLRGQAVTLTAPDFTAAGGFLAIYAPSGAVVNTFLEAFGPLGTPGLNKAACTEGAIFTYGSLSGTN